MSKIRVHELAKQLDKTNKEILGLLSDNKVNVKSHMSTLEEDQVAFVTNAFKSGKSTKPVASGGIAAPVKPATANTASPVSQADAAKTQSIPTQGSGRTAQGTSNQAQGTPNQAQGTSNQAQGQIPKKKSNISQVYHPQYSQSGASNRTNRQGYNKNTTKPAEKSNYSSNRPDTTNNIQTNDNNRNRDDRLDNNRRSMTQNNQNYAQTKGNSPQRTSETSQNRVTNNDNRNNAVTNRTQQGQSRPAGTGNKSAGGYNRPTGTDNRSTGGYNRQAGSDNKSTGGYNRPAGSDNRPAGGYNRPAGTDNRPAGGYNRPAGTDNRPAGGYNRPAGTDNRSAGGYNRSAGTDNRSAGTDNRSTGSYNRPAGSNTRSSGSDNRPTGGYNRPAGSDNRSTANANRTTGNYNRPTGSDNRNTANSNRPAGADNKSGVTRTYSTPNKAPGGAVRTQGGPNRPNQGGNRPNQGRRPNQGGNRPNQRGGGKRSQPQMQAASIEKDVIKTITLPDTLTIKELADKMKIPASTIIKKLFLQGTMVTVNHDLDYDAAEEIALEFDCIAEHEIKIDVIEELLREEEEEESKLKPRPPVVCVMGHVDHGKTSLLDAIRKTKVIDKEAGGITQHIGAYVVSIDDQKITFLDTPGHEAFTAMRMRGANSTDIAILVVAADDGVMPQTVEAINHAKAAGIEIIVAINKIDKPSANIEKVKQELSEYELIPEDWGGSTIFVPVSAHSYEGIDQLLEMILLTAEVCELKANPDRKARGLVIEAELDKGKGSVATILVQKGTLRVGDSIAAGSCYGKVRAMMDDKGRRVKEAGPSVPVEILGLSDVPNAGEIFVAPETEKEARSFAETFISEGREKLLEDTKAKMSLDDLFTQIQAGNLKELDIIIKADVQGSVEAVKQSLLKLSNEEVLVKVIHGGVGAINESDVILASASNAIIIGFNVRPDVTAKQTAEREGVDLRLYRVIYDAINDVEAAMKGMRDPVFEEKVLGHAEVRQTFSSSGVGTIAGSYVLDGVFQRGCSVRIKREDKQIFEGKLASVKRFKDDVKEVKAGYECGLVFEKFNDVIEGDLVEAYTMVEVPR